MQDNELERLLADLGDAQPKYFTKPTPGAVNDLEAARIIGKALGTPLFPWQALVIRVMSERRADDPTRYRYPRVIITTPRQVGKTTMYRIYQVTKALLQPGRIAFFTAQTGKDARARWKDITDALTRRESPLKKTVTMRYSAGDSSITFKNGSIIAPFAPTAESLHGYTPHDVAIDEAFAFDEVQGTDLMGAIIPAQQRIPDRQLVIFSTAGNRDSTFLKNLVDEGRQSLNDPEAQTAYFEWSMADGADPDDPDSWRFHPGVTGEFTMSDLADQHKEFETRPGEWLRAYMNTWVETDEHEKILTPEQVHAVTTSELEPPSHYSEVALAYEIATDRSRSVIAAAWYDTTGTPCIRIAERLPYGEDLAAAVAKAADGRPLAYGADDGGATRDITKQLTKQGYTPELINARDFATATDAFIARVKARKIHLDNDTYLKAAIDDAVLRRMNQVFALDRVKSRGEIPELIAAVIALQLLETREQQPKPLVRF